MSSQEWFDDLSRVMASHLPRRQALKLILVGAAAQFLPFPRMAWARDSCGDRDCPEDLDCSRFNRHYCIEKNGKETILACSYFGRDCVSGKRGKCGLVEFPVDCQEPTPFCHEKDRAARCVDCRVDSHCKDRRKGVECCKNICCKICDKCTKDTCIPRCPPKGDATKVQCCTKPGDEDRGPRFTKCCKKGCCDEMTGECIKPDGKISKASGTQLQLMIQEPTVGIGNIQLYDVLNAEVEIPPFVDGTTEPVYVIATRIDLGEKSTVLLTVSPASACDCDECSEIVDPTLTELVIPAGRNQVIETFERIPKHEHFVTIQNGDPGLRRVQVLVNGEPAAERWLREGTARFLDVASRMTEEENVITVVANGRPGTSALLVIADVPNTSTAPGASEATIPILWEPSTWQPGQNLTWGR